MSLKDKSTTKKKKRNYFFFHFVKVTGSPVVLWMRPKVFCAGSVRPKDVKGGAIITANHNSFFDPVFGYCVFWRRIMHLVATKDLYNTKTKDFFFRHVQCIQVDKENFSMTCFHEVKEVLQEDKLVMIFPEGKLNLEKTEMLPFKSGAILMANSTGKPIIPMYIIPGKKWYNRWHGVLGDPIDVKAICGPFPTLEKINQVSALLQEKEQELKEFYLRKTQK